MPVNFGLLPEEVFFSARRSEVVFDLFAAPIVIRVTVVEKFRKISVIYRGCGGIRSHDRLEGGLGSRGRVASSVFTGQPSNRPVLFLALL